MSINIYIIAKPSSEHLYYRRTFSHNGKVINQKTYYYDEDMNLRAEKMEMFFKDRKNLTDGKLIYRKIKSFNSRSKDGKELLKLIFQNNIEQIDNFLIDKGVRQWYINNNQVYIDITTNNIYEPSTIPSQNTTTRNIKKVNLEGELNKTKTYFKNKEDFLRKYKILDGMNSLSIPYINYDDNKTHDSKCVYHYLVKNYISTNNKNINRKCKKDIEEFNKLGGTNPEEIINFCNKYDIKCVLYNLIGNKIYDNEKESHHNKLDFIAILANNHLYPLNNKFKTHKPLLNKDTEIKEEKENEISIQINDKLYFKDGYIDLTEEEDKEEKLYDNVFMKNIFPNFTYESLKQCLTIRPLLFMDKDIESYDRNEVFAYDVNKAYYQVAKTTKDEELCPFYTVQDIPQIYDKSKIENHFLYFLKKSTLKNLSSIGITSNNIYGDVLNLLIKNKIVKKTDIEYFLKCSYTQDWRVFKERINKSEKEKLMKDTFKFYNGLLGSTTKNTTYKYNNIIIEDEFLLEGLENNTNYSACFENKKLGSFELYKSTFKHINHKNIYNFIVNKTVLMVLTQLFKIKKAHPEVKLLKIRTDSLTFDKEITSLKINNVKGAYKGWKVEKNPKLIYCGHNLQYNDIKTINKELKQEIKEFSKNVEIIQGAAGVGKTHYIKNNKSYDYALTTTNLCLFNMTNEKNIDTTKYKTIYSFLSLGSPEDLLSKIKKYKNKTIWIDEFSMINLFIYNYLFVLGTTNNNKFIISGDINQIEPVGEKKIDLNNLFFSEMFKNTTTLKTNYRNDKKIIELRENVLNNTIEQNNKVFSKLHSKKDFKKFDIHIVATNDYKNSINNEIMKARKQQFNENEISKNLILQVSQTRKKLNIFKNDRFKVEKTEKDTVYLNNLRNNEILSLSKEDTLKFLEVGYAITCHSSQGLTITEDFSIHQIKKMIEWNKEILYTAITRAKNYKQLNLYYEPVVKPLKLNKNIFKFNKFDDVIYDY